MRTVLLLLFCLGISATLSAQSVDNSAAKVQRIQGLYVFVDSEPVANYDYLGSVYGANVGMKSPQYTVVRDGLIKKLKEDYPDANGIILHLSTGQKDKADAIKFK